MTENSVGMSDKRPPPDPIAVLRGHRSSVMDACFHPCLPLLFTGATDGELRAWDAVQHRTLSSTWAHSGGAGVYCVAMSPSIGNRVGRDGTCKCWEVQEAGLSRMPLTTFRTGGYHFCKLSLVKSSSSGEQLWQSSSSNEKVIPSSIQGEEPKTKFAPQESVDGMCKGEFSVQDNLIAHGPGLMALAGEESSQVEIWDLNNAERIMCLPQSSNPCFKENLAKQRGQYSFLIQKRCIL
ncbi:Coatomer subunit beta'-2 [Apostasia shenzhenica]|uniref:Coatomer subunit beta'-2 n=1 Tax=Apostasia shenzhenica TaxID=1088818 RepID=A0A2H9ZWM3_9ASPA|nr:Coatomer subunit beta'-2 [Apostasia shenzhenica]